MYSITGVISSYYSKSMKITLKIYDGLNSSDLKTPTSEWITVSTDKEYDLKAGDQIKATIQKDKTHLVSIAKLNSVKLDNFKNFFIGLNLKGTSMKDRIRLFNAFGTELLNLAEKRVPILINNATKYGYSMQSAVIVASKPNKILDLYDATVSLSKANFSEKERKYLIEKFSTVLGTIVKENPYMLLAGGVSKFPDPFSDAFKEKSILKKIDSLVDNPLLPKWQQTRAFYVLEVIIKRLSGSGSTAFSKSEVNDELSKILDIDYSDASELLESTLTGKAYKVLDSGAEGYFITPTKNYNLEEDVATRLIERMNEKDVSVPSRDLIFEDKYTDEQRQSIKLAIEKNILVITGGAGTGKTTTVKGIIQNIKKVFGRHSEILLCAPTGKAAQRMTEATLIDANTLHSMLKYNPNTGFADTGISSETTAVIVDESSMVDSALMLKLLVSLPKSTKLILVGDMQQILPVNPGQPFKDMILSELLPTVRLSVPQRTGNDSYIYFNANKVINGVMPTLDNDKMNDFTFIKTYSDQESNEKILKILAEDIETVYGSKLSKVQVISPKREPKGLVGMTPLNRDIQSLLNPNVPQSKQGDSKIEPQVGDKVVFNTNDYTLKLSNGDVGYVTKKDKETGAMSINVDGKSIDIPHDKTKKLDLAFALSAHKTQGSEYDVVIMPLSKGHAHMLSPELLYTAITRAKKHFIFVGDESVIKSALKNIHLNQRNTYLKARLIEYKNELNKTLIHESQSQSLEGRQGVEVKESTEGKVSSTHKESDASVSKSVTVDEEFDWDFG